MHCPKCGHDNSKVIESRDTGDAVRRRRECLDCGNRYTTYERIER
ncbi:transcriptional regulator NrdR, partial [Candidatus Saccharibacteria bacterium]|nr:transcriptional regulator NrdR [Candidatus Saccharibacteria bacterium]